MKNKYTADRYVIRMSEYSDKRHHTLFLVKYDLLGSGSQINILWTTNKYEANLYPSVQQARNVIDKMEAVTKLFSDIIPVYLTFDELEGRPSGL